MRHIPVPVWPMRLTRHGDIDVLEQDSGAEIVQSVNVLLHTRPNDRLSMPTYGLDDPTFTLSATAVEGVTDIVQRHEPRATVDEVHRAVRGDGTLTVSLEVDHG